MNKKIYKSIIGEVLSWVSPFKSINYSDENFEKLLGIIQKNGDVHPKLLKNNIKLADTKNPITLE